MKRTTSHLMWLGIKSLTQLAKFSVIRKAVSLSLILLLVFIISCEKEEKTNVIKPNETPVITLKTAAFCEASLIAAQNISIGTVTATYNDAGNVITIVYSVTFTDCCLVKTHLDIQADPANFPMTNGGDPNPKVGQFEYGASLPCVPTWSQVVDLSTVEGWTLGCTIYIAAQADVTMPDGGQEGAWAGDLPFPGNNWAKYFSCSLPPLSAVASATPAEIILGQSFQLDVTATGGTGSYFYSWTSDPIGFTSTLKNLSISPTITTTYTCVVTSANLSATATTAVTVYSLLTAVASSTPAEITSGQSSQLDVTATGGTGSYTYTWTSDPTGFISTIKNPSVSPTVTTTYTCIITSGSQEEDAMIAVTVVSPQCGGLFIDSRDGQSYKTVLIGDQCWFSENLNVGNYVPSILGGYRQLNDGNIEKYCYDNNEANCEVYGGLYEWPEAMQYSTTEGVQGICPLGWHLPTNNEWKVLEGTVDSQYGVGDPVWNTEGWRGLDAGGKSKETGYTHWVSPNTSASNTSGFTGLPGGYRRYEYGEFRYLNEFGYFWSSSQASLRDSFYRTLIYNNAKIYMGNDSKADGFSIRCLKDTD